MGDEGFDVIVEDGDIVNNLGNGVECRNCCDVKEEVLEGGHLGMCAVRCRNGEWCVVIDFGNCFEVRRMM